MIKAFLKWLHGDERIDGASGREEEKLELDSGGERR